MNNAEVVRPGAPAQSRTAGPTVPTPTSHAGITRRRVLTGTGAGAIALGLEALRPTRANARPPQRATVVIVGAGIAGLGCAYRLWDKYRIRAEVHEWSERPGGRIQTLRGWFDDGQLIEEHAEFINPEHVATLALARRFHLTLDDTDRYPGGIDPGQESFRFDGRRWPMVAADRDWQSFGRSLFQDAATKASFPTTYRRSTPSARAWDQMSAADWVDAYVPGGSAGDFGQLCLAAVLDEYGGPSDQVSALNLIYLLGADSSTSSGRQPRSAPALGGGDEKWHIHGGNDQLVTGIVRRLPAGTLHLGRRLLALREAAGGRVVATFGGGGTPELVAEHVVLALPFTTLRQVDTSAVAIPPLHRRAIDEEPLGSNAKFFAQYSTRVWDARRQTGNGYSDTLVQGTWDATGYQPGGAGILAALPGGVVGRQWGPRYGLNDYRGQPPERMVADYLAGFEQLFPGSRARFNGKAFYVWSAGDPYALGAYSYLAVGQYTAFNGIQGQQEGRLHFAGEHTSMNFQGYVEGALRSGYRCADEIAESGNRPAARSASTA